MKNKKWKIKYRGSKIGFNAFGFFRIPLSTFDFESADSRLGRMTLSTRAHARGVATLPTVMLLGIMALVVAVSVTTLSFTELLISQGSAQSSRALFYAESGARDALMRIARNKNYSYTTGDGYTIDFSTDGCGAAENDCAKVLVSTGTGGDGNPKIITSKGIMKSSTRTIQVSVSIDTNGQIATSTTQTVWSEI